MSRKIVHILICLALLISATSCFKDRKIYLDLNRSINVGRPGDDFPNVDKLPANKREAYEIYGTPDLVRFWWNEEDRIYNYLEVDRTMKQKMYEVPHSWIYVEEGIEAVFDDEDDSWHEVPLSDKLRVVCQYGDPEAQKTMSRGDEGPVRENWNYFSRGLILKFEDDKLVGRQRHHPMGHFIKK